jgi:hypothetical protein
MKTQTTHKPTSEKLALQLIATGIKKMLKQMTGPKSRIPNNFAKAMTTKLDDFRKLYPSPEILPMYTFGEKSQRLFLNQISQDNPQLIRIHLALTDDSFKKNYGLSEDFNHVQYLFEFGNNGVYYILFNTDFVKDVNLKDFERCTNAYKDSPLYKNLCEYIKNETSSKLTENTERILIDDLATGTNEVYNLIVKNQNNVLKPFYIYPSVQLLDLSLDSTVDKLMRSASQLYSFGIIISSKENISDPTAVIDDRHYHCPPNEC